LTGPGRSPELTVAPQVVQVVETGEQVYRQKLSAVIRLQRAEPASPT